MPEEPQTTDLVELVRGTYAALNARDFDAVLQRFGADSFWDVTCWGLGTHTGLAAIGHFLEDWFGSLAGYEVRIEEMHELGNGVIWLVVLQIAHPVGSRSLLRVQSAPVFVWAQGRIEQLTLYRDSEEARAAGERLAAQREVRAQPRGSRSR